MRSRTVKPKALRLPRKRLGLRRSFTFIEAIAASVLLSTVAGSVVASVSALTGFQERSINTLRCAELANRLAIQWLDDAEARPPEIIPLAGHDFRWEIVEERLDVQGAFEENTSARTRPLGLARRITVSVWLHDRPETYATPLENPRFTLSRYLDLLSTRNPDTAEWVLENEALMQRFFRAVSGEQDETTNTREERREQNRSSDPARSPGDRP